MRWIVFSLVAVLFVAAVPEKDRPLTWIQLFNGKNLKDWKPKIAGYPLGENYAGTFGVSEGKIKVSYRGYEKFDERYGHLFYKQPFSYYLLAVEYRFTGAQARGGPDWAFRNSGAMIHCQRSTANLCTPGTNVVMKGKLFTDHCINSTSKTFHGDQWVRVEVLVLGDSLVKHIVEGDTVLTYEKPQIGDGNVSNYDPKEKLDGKPLTKGYISLQSESHPVEFRKVELVDLEPYAHDPRKLAKALASLRHRN